MSTGTENTANRIEIKDLPPEETLTPEEKERLAGAGRYRPSFEALEAREMLSATPVYEPPVSKPTTDPPAGHVQILSADSQHQPAAHSTDGTTGANAPSAPLAAHVDGAMTDFQPPATHNDRSGTVGATPNAPSKQGFSEDFNAQPVVDKKTHLMKFGTGDNRTTWYADNTVEQNNKNVTYTNSGKTLNVVDDPDTKDGKALAMTIVKTGVDNSKHHNPLYESARITTQYDPTAGHFQYGRVEARMRLSAVNGSDPVWPGFWMLGDNLPSVGWPKCGEIDIMEYNGVDRTTTGTLITPDQHLYQNSYHGASLADGKYHTFAIDWTENEVRFSVDGGDPYATLRKGVEIPEDKWNFNKPFFVILNVAARPGQPADFTSQTVYVDYVRYTPTAAPTSRGNEAPTTSRLAAAASQPSSAPTSAATPATAAPSSDQADIQKKLAEIREVEGILKKMDVPDLPYAQWLDGQSAKNQKLTETDQTELDLKQSEITKLESQPHPKASILAAEKAELAIMQDKMAKMSELQTAIGQAQQTQAGADQRVADLTLGISEDELNLKNQQVAALQERVHNSPAGKEHDKLQNLLDGEKYEVKQLTQIVTLNQRIADLVRSGGDAATLAGLRREVVQHELLMKQQNERQLEARLKPDSGAPKDDSVGGGNSALTSAAAHTATPLAATSAGHSNLKGVLLPAGPHLMTQGTINIAYKDGKAGTESIRYKETNPKMFGPTTADNGLWEQRLPVLAAELLNGAKNTDMIFLDAEVDPVKLDQLMKYQLPGTDGQLYSLSSLHFKYVNVAGPVTGDRAAVIYNSDKYTVTNHNNDPSQTHAVGADAHKSRAGSQAVEYISRFEVTTKAGNRFDLYLGKGPHNESNNADFLTTRYKNNESMLQWIANQSGDTPAIIVGDWNNELNTQAVNAALKGHHFDQTFQNHYNVNGSLDRAHAGSNAEDLLTDKNNGSYNTGQDITKVKVQEGDHAETWDWLKSHGKLNTQVLSFANQSIATITVTNPRILRDIGPYGTKSTIDPYASPADFAVIG